MWQRKKSILVPESDPTKLWSFLKRSQQLLGQNALTGSRFSLAVRLSSRGLLVLSSLGLGSEIRAMSCWQRPKTTALGERRGTATALCRDRSVTASAHTGQATKLTAAKTAGLDTASTTSSAPDVADQGSESSGLLASASLLGAGADSSDSERDAARSPMQIKAGGAGATPATEHRISRTLAGLNQQLTRVEQQLAAVTGQHTHAVTGLGGHLQNLHEHLTHHQRERTSLQTELDLLRAA